MNPEILSTVLMVAHIAAVIGVGVWLKKRYGLFPALVGAAFVLFLFPGWLTGQ